jgi:hypothetical protein
MGFVLLLTAAAFVQLKRMQGVDVSTPLVSAPTEDSHVDETVREEYFNQSEKLLGAIFGVMNQKQRGFSWLGAGKMWRTENTLLFTDSRIAAIEAPIAGSDKLLGDVSYSQMVFFWNRGEIKNNAERLLRTMTIQEILDSKASNYAWTYDEIQLLDINSKYRRITVTLRNGQKVRLLYMDQIYIETLNGILPGLLHERYTVNGAKPSLGSERLGSPSAA